MQAFRRHRGLLVPYIAANVDTDQIIPARFLHRPRKQGYGSLLFHDLRHDDAGRPKPDFVLNRDSYRTGTILLAGPNFGCGSSREHAVWALVDHGFKAVIAPGFGDIFYNNCGKNGLLAIVAEAAVLNALAEEAHRRPGASATIDLPEQSIALGQDRRWSFSIDPYRKQALLEGASEIEMTLKAIGEIEAFEAEHRSKSPWIAPSESGPVPPRPPAARNVRPDRTDTRQR